ncbi:MAG: PLP-dependent transferase [Atopobiaceae bacterium]|jgi:O-acetylhomoserine/O-acetylserine sulfhydrylase-like pyridoxal-dependent enzyme|nr:PLP-dependent transferase [Atopobiaceae bacterium]MCH4181288.1 PLP-dependent transferase [Atopobiaceae bacterium]MCH4213786.1 PLP-dependent transferase [Atopobiaceae bacterium]MCH4229781.1 PLP-dependent transferase [Atopobiaceae bacterium]MCH4277296.1 PLP-dependent transferase [Atopobiaceae bacterium]
MNDASTTPEATCAAGVARLLGAGRAWLVDLSGVDEAVRAAGLDAALLLPVLGVAPDGARVDVTDLPARSEASHAKGEPLVVDVSSVGLSGCVACAHGADVAVCALDGGGVAIGLSRDALRAEVSRDIVWHLNDLPQLRLLETDLERSCRCHRDGSDVAAVVARYLSCHPAVAAVSYPGLPADPSFPVASRVLAHGFGPLVLYRLAVAPDAGMTMLDCAGDSQKALIEALESRIAHTSQ